MDENSNTMNLEQYRNIEITEPVQNGHNTETTMKSLRPNNRSAKNNRSRKLFYKKQVNNDVTRTYM